MKKREQEQVSSVFPYICWFFCFFFEIEFYTQTQARYFLLKKSEELKNWSKDYHTYFASVNASSNSNPVKPFEFFSEISDFQVLILLLFSIERDGNKFARGGRELCTYVLGESKVPLTPCKYHVNRVRMCLAMRKIQHYICSIF